MGQKVFVCDLHTHSTASDGQYTPSELVRLAAKDGIEVLALTDHDTTDGIDEAVKAGNGAGIRVIPGIEVSAAGHRNFHILGYNWKTPAPLIDELSARMKRSRESRKHAIVEYLKGKGVRISLDEVESEADGVIGKPHFAAVLVKHGYAESVKDAFDKYLNTSEFRSKIRREKPTAKECVEIIKNSGGKVSLAHPYQLELNNTELENLVRELKSYGLDAIECYYPKYTKQQEEFYSWLTSEYDLAKSGGSDFHGERVKPGTQLSHLELNVDWIL